MQDQFFFESLQFRLMWKVLQMLIYEKIYSIIVLLRVMMVMYKKHLLRGFDAL